jgi:type IV secretory pathway VirB2 component (pilin)
MKPLLSKLKFQNFKVAICKSAKVLFVLFMLLVSFPSVGNATTPPPQSSLAEDNALTRVLCNVYRVVTGKAGKTFAAFAIISAGIGFFTGKLQWGLLIALTLGIAAIFGAPTIVSAITGDSTTAAGACATQIVQ